MTRRVITIYIACATVILGGIICVGYSYFIEPNRLVANDVTISVKGWDPAFDGIRIVAIGDIHGGSNGGSAENIRRVVELANQQSADVIVLLGDYVAELEDRKDPETGKPILLMPVSEVADNLSGLKAKYGVFAVLGNHDGFYGDTQVATELRRVGYTILENEIAVIERDGEKLRLLGLKDHMHLNSWYTFDTDMKRLQSESNVQGDVILLEHSPDIFQVANHYKSFGDDFKLMLAAHTHGGQVWLPVLGRPIVPSSFGQKYAAGHVYEFGKDMFVTSGVGTSILPFRFFVPPEIAVLTIRSQ